MELAKNESTKNPDMVMCGDHPSFTKNSLNAKDVKEEKEKIPTYAKISPKTSRTATVPSPLAITNASEARTRVSDHTIRLIEARRLARSLEHLPRPEIECTSGNRALVQAALGSFRWPPYLLAVWVVLLVLTHALHCIVTMMERALPNVKKLCQYLRTWTAAAWKDEGAPSRVLPAGLALLTAHCYCWYYALYAVYCVAVWSIEPLCSEQDEQSDVEAKVTNYVEEMCSKTNIKH